jgi:hypothetical protein
MPIFTPQSVDFRVVGPGSKNGKDVMSDAFAGEDHVTATITNDTSGGGFRVGGVTSYVLVTSYESDPGINHGKPYKVTNYEETGQTNGITPLTVSKGQVVSVTVNFVAPAQSTDTARAATLEIHGDAWTASVPLTVLVGQISINLPTISILQGHVVNVPIKVVSVAGPPTTVTLSTDPSTSFPPGISFSVSPASVQVSNGSPATVTLQLGASFDAGVGNWQLNLNVSAFNGWPWTLLFSPTVVAPKLNPNSPIAAKYASLGGPASYLGSPTAAEAICGDFQGQFRSYANGAIYWSGVDGSQAFAVHGPIWSAGYNNADSPISPGYPTSDVVVNILLPLLGTTPTISNSISIGHFQNGGSYSKPTTGLHFVPEPFFQTYTALGENSGVLGFPIAEPSGDATYDFLDFENGGLFSPSPYTTVKHLTAVPGVTTVAPSTVLDQVNQALDDAVQKYNAAADFTFGPIHYGPLSMQGGPTFQDPSDPVTDYSYVPAPGSYVLSRRYKIHQDFFVSFPVAPDMTIALDFELLLLLDGPSEGGKDINGNNTGATLQSIVAQVINLSANVDGHDNPAITDSVAQKIHDQIIAAAQTAQVTPIPLPGGGDDPHSFLAVKVLTTGTGVGIIDRIFTGIGTAAVLTKNLPAS